MSKSEELQLIPLSEKYIEYILKIIFKIPRVEKYSIGTEYKKSMYEMLRQIMYINKLENINIVHIKRFTFMNQKKEKYKAQNI